MLARISIQNNLPNSDQLCGISHLLAVLPAGDSLPADCPARQSLMTTLARRNKTANSLCQSPVAGHLPGGGLISWCMLNQEKSSFEQLTVLCKATQLLLEEEPVRLDIVLIGASVFCNHAAELACYVALTNGASLPTLKQQNPPKSIEVLTLWGGDPGVKAPILAEGNLLARTFTALPPNILTPTAYRERLRDLATDLNWEIDEIDNAQLEELGAGAFLAVAAGSMHDDAAIVRLSYIPQKSQGKIALVGKGICFDTGGHHLKPAKSMAGMHEDMSGSAVVVGILLAATRLNLPIRIDAWLALARNEISPCAYRPGDIVTALNGSTIEIVHTDAEGRMVLADTLTLAVREEPQLLIDFATLTGSMVTALGTRYAGVFANTEPLAALAVEAGKASGERICIFPMDADYDEELESCVADIKQCTLESDADHILATRFLKRFVGNTPWLHVDLSTANSKNGLGAIHTAQTGFGVTWGMEFLQRWITNHAKPAVRKKNAGVH